MFAARDIPKGARGQVIRVNITQFRSMHRVDIREYYEQPGADALAPTRKGINLPIGDLPRLRVILEQAEESALAAGMLAEQDYELAGLPVPLTLTT